MASGKYAREKGFKAERLVAKWFRDIGFRGAKTSRSGDRSKDSGGVDVIGIDRFCVQVKAYKNYCPINKIEEIKDIDESIDIPILVAFANNKEPMVVLPAKHFMILIKET